MDGVGGAAFGPSRWRGQPGRLEVWYATFTDPATGDGFWLHHELVAPVDGGGRPFVHGWAAVFPHDAAPALARFGPEPWVAPGHDAWFRCGDVVVDAGGLRGSAGDVAWDLARADHAAPLFTFPRAVWERELLPAAQIVPEPTASFRGEVRVDQRTFNPAPARGALARIYGHGNGRRWGWLHADLGDGDVLEVVAAVARRPGLRRLPPLALVRLRLDGRDWPANPLLAAPRFRVRIDPPAWSVRGAGLAVSVTIPPERAVVLGYSDPDGASATCTNSERADAEIVRGDRRWRLAGTAHAELGSRP